MWTMLKSPELQESPSLDPLGSLKLTEILTSGWRACALGMVVGTFQVFHHGQTELILHRNILKLRKEERLAQERGEGSATGTPAAHEKTGDRLGHHPEVTEFEVDALQSGRETHAERDDWRDVCLPLILPPPH
jgi:hypothetical protein